MAGSADWANAALRGSKADVERAWSKNAKVYAQHLTRRAGSAVDHEDDEQIGAEPIALLGRSSAAGCCCGPYTGKPRGPRLEANIAIVYELANVSQNTARQELAVIESRRPNQEVTPKSMAKTSCQPSMWRQRRPNVVPRHSNMLTDLKERSALTIRDQCGRISSALHEVVRRFSEVECWNMRAALFEGGGGVCRCYLVPRNDSSKSVW